jgi:hypothetical protein
MAHGGKREGAGRKPKADEIKLIEQMDAIAAPHEAWEKLWELCKSGEIQAVKTWIAYRFGQPKQSIDVTSGDEPIRPPIVWAKKED